MLVQTPGSGDLHVKRHATWSSPCRGYSRGQIGSRPYNDVEESVLKSVILLCAVVVLSACAPKIVLTDRETGEMGRGAASGATFGSGGEISVNIQGEQYTGSWVAMRDPGNAALTFWSMGPKDSGVGIANLTSPSGKFLRCEFGYNMTSLSGIGLCKERRGSTYDFMLSFS